MSTADVVGNKFGDATRHVLVECSGALHQRRRRWNTRFTMRRIPARTFLSRLRLTGDDCISGFGCSPGGLVEDRTPCARRFSSRVDGPGDSTTVSLTHVVAVSETGEWLS